jgi:hypothetical protein
MNDLFFGIFDWIKDDWKSNKIRFILEVFAWAASIWCAIVFAISVPVVPFHILYPIWISGCAIYCWAAYTRRSFGMVANYMLLTCIDTVGYIRYLNT